MESLRRVCPNTSGNSAAGGINSYKIPQIVRGYNIRFGIEKLYYKLASVKGVEEQSIMTLHIYFESHHLKNRGWGGGKRTVQHKLNCETL